MNCRGVGVANDVTHPLVRYSTKAMCTISGASITGVLSTLSASMLLALLCTPALAVRNFRPTLLRPRAPHLRTAALRPACIALDPDLQPVGDTEAVTWPFCARLHRRCTETFFLLTVDSCVIRVCDAGVM